MSYTGCQFSGKHAQVDGTSYGVVLAVAFSEASRTAADVVQQRIWEEKLQYLRQLIDRYGTDLIGSTFDELVLDQPDEKREFVRALCLAEAKLHSFGGTLPNQFLRDVIGQGDRVGYIQQGEYDSAPFVKTIRTLRNLLDGIESY